MGDDQPITVVGGSLYIGGASKDKWEYSAGAYESGGGFALAGDEFIFSGVEGRFLSKQGEITFSTARAEGSALRVEIDYRHGIWPLSDQYTVVLQTKPSGRGLRAGSAGGKKNYRCLVSPVQNLLLMARKGEVDKIRILGTAEPRTFSPLDGMFELSLTRHIFH